MALGCVLPGEALRVPPLGSGLRLTGARTIRNIEACISNNSVPDGSVSGIET